MAEWSAALQKILGSNPGLSNLLEKVYRTRYGNMVLKKANEIYKFTSVR